MPALNVNGVPLHYVVEGTGTPLLLIHGFPLSHEMWRPQIDALKGSYRVIAPDLRGFGRSGARGTTTMETYASDCVAILDALKIDSAFVGGLSMGGYIAMAMLRVDAGRVRGLILVDTQATPDDDAGKQKREENARRVEQEGVGFLAEQLRPKLLSKGAPQKLHQELTALMTAQSREGVAGALRGMAQRPDSKDVLSRFSGPALVIVGTEDEITPVAKAKQMAEIISGAELATIPGAAHMSNMEAPEAVNATVREFLRKASA